MAGLLLLYEQLYDIEENVWRPIDVADGIFWCGEAAATITNGIIKPGIHRVIINKKNLSAIYSLV